MDEDIPQSVLEYGFDFDWDESDVWRLDYPNEDMNIEELEWHLDVPFWENGGKDYSLCPRDVLNNPEKYKEHYDRIMNSDINYPIDVMFNKGRYVILDGVHRLVKSKLLGMKYANVRIIPRDEIKNISK